MSTVLRVIGLLICIVSPAFSDGWDPGDDFASGASALSPGALLQVHGPHDLSATDLGDWYAVSMVSGVYYVFDTDGGVGDSLGELYSDMAGTNLVASDNNSAGAMQFRLSYLADMTQTYYLRVRCRDIGSVWMGSLRYWTETPPIPSPTPVPTKADAEEPRLVVYPNPLRGDTLNLAVVTGVQASSLNLSLYDMGLRRVYQESWNLSAKGELKLLLHGMRQLRPGPYLVRMRVMVEGGGERELPVARLLVAP